MLMSQTLSASDQEALTNAGNIALSHTLWILGQYATTEADFRRYVHEYVITFLRVGTNLVALGTTNQQGFAAAVQRNARRRFQLVQRDRGFLKDRCQEVKTATQQFCTRLKAPFSDGTPSGCNHADCNLDIYSYCVKNQMLEKGGNP
jgi:hypothetical protein